MGGNYQILKKFRDLQVAEDIRKKAALGYFEVEFTMYGCAYLDRNTDKMKYRISSLAEDIYIFIEKAAKMDIYPSKVEKLSTKCLVPLGAKELIEQDIKGELAKELKRKYSKDFFKALYNIADNSHSNDASIFLWKEAERLEGIFEKEQLDQFEMLIEYLFSCKNILRSEYEKLIQWLAEERSSMVENFVSKDIFEKTIYGFAYIENNSLKYVHNTQIDTIYHELYELEQNGLLISPVYEKTFWYNYKYRLKDVINDYKKELKSIYNDDFMKNLKEMKGHKNKESQEQFNDLLKNIKENYGEDSMITLRRYGYRWGLLS